MKLTDYNKLLYTSKSKAIQDLLQEHNKMDIFDGRYYKSCKWFLVHTGLWPFQSNYKRRLGHLAWYVVNTTIVVPQILLLIKEFGNDLTVTCENVMSIMFALGCSAKFSTASLKITQIRLLFIQITKDWKSITDKSECDILKKYNEQGRVLVIFYTIYVFGAWIIYTFLPFLPYILDRTFPLKNGTRPLLFSFYADYIFFEQVDYHYWTVWHAVLVYLHSAFLFSSIDTTFVLTVKHTCGLFAVTCYRLNIKEKNTKSMAELDKEIRKAITLHNETIRCCRLIEDSFNTCFLLVQCLSIFGLAVAVVYMLHIIDDLLTLSRIVIVSAGLIMHLLYLHWVGQQIINSSEKTLNSAYFSEWYRFSINSRKLTSITMTRSLRPCYLTAGKITNLSMESYEKILKCVVSYCTVFLSVM